MSRSIDSEDDQYDTNQKSSLLNGLIKVNEQAAQQQEASTAGVSRFEELRSITCPSCRHKIHFQDDRVGIMVDLPSLPAGVKFDPSDCEILMHLEAKSLPDKRKLHPLMDEFIPTLEVENGICYTLPEKLPGVSKDGQAKHFFHRPSKAYTTGTRKRRKISTNQDGNETRWHKTGKTRPIYNEGYTKGFKKILVLYTYFGRQKKPEKTNWIMHQYHLGQNEEEKEGELIVSKVFYQTQPRHSGSTVVNDSDSVEKRSKNARTRHKDYEIVKNKTVPLVLYGYDYHGAHSRENPPQLIPNMVVQRDGSSFFQLASETSEREAS